jgi:ABC-2 type transport system ATP-binding protein
MAVSPLDGHAEAYKTLPGVRNLVHEARDGASHLQFILESEDALSQVVARLGADHARILHLQKREPTLEDVFVDLVGLSMAEAESAEF